MQAATGESVVEKNIRFPRIPFRKTSYLTCNDVCFPRFPAIYDNDDLLELGFKCFEEIEA